MEKGNEKKTTGGGRSPDSYGGNTVLRMWSKLLQRHGVLWGDER